MTNRNMTAVEWLINQLKIRGYAGEFPPHLLFEQSKQMEKEQIMNAYIEASPRLSDIITEAAEQYYNETYVTTKQ